MARKSILLIGSYGRGNIGDDAFLLAALELFRDARMYSNSANDALLPAEARKKVTTIATNGLKDFGQKLRVFAQLDHLVYCGGDLWVELYGDRFPRQSLYKMLAVNLVARMCGKKVHYLGCGAGKLKGYSLFLARLSAKLATSVAVREPRTAKLLKLPNVTVLPDLTVNLPDIPKRRHKKGKKIILGVSLLYYVPNPETNFPILLAALASLLQSLPREKYKIILFPMLVASDVAQDDLWACQQLKNKLSDQEVSIFASRDVKDCLQALADLDFLIGARLHANILGTLVGTPCLGISYRPKVRQFFEMNNLGAYCLDLDELSKLPKLFATMQADLPHITTQLQQVSQENKTKRRAYQRYIRAHF